MSQKVTKWTRRQRKAIEWFAADKYKRSPETQEALAEQIGVARETVSRWKKRDGFWDAVNELARERFRNDIAQYYAALMREAIKGNFQHLKLALEMAGEVEQEKANETTVIVIAHDREANQPLSVTSGAEVDKGDGLAV